RGRGCRKGGGGVRPPARGGKEHGRAQGAESWPGGPEKPSALDSSGEGIVPAPLLVRRHHDACDTRPGQEGIRFPPLRSDSGEAERQRGGSAAASGAASKEARRAPRPSSTTRLLLSDRKSTRLN